MVANVAGEATKGLVQGAASKHARLKHAGKTVPDWNGDDTSELTTSEILSDGMKMDATGELLGHGGHFTLILKIFTNRNEDRSQVGRMLKKVRETKQATWKRTGSWPWWTVHNLEQFYHTDPRSLAADIPEDIRRQAGRSVLHGD
jgi:hypothetical protein